jgi:dihydroorotase (multifunctional complex type)
MTALIRGGRIWTGSTLERLSILVDDDGRIGGLLSPDFAADLTVREVIEAGGLLILPGGVDMHVHVSDGSETFTAGTSAAACGGITTVIDMAPFHGCVTAEDYRAKVAAAAARCVTDFGLCAGIVVSQADLLHLNAVAALGAACFKLFMPADPPANADLLWAAVQAAANTGLRLGVHAEEAACFVPEPDWGDPLGFPRSRPPVAESSAVAQVLEMARAAGAPVHICHVSTGRTADLIEQARGEGVDVTAEVPPHFLLLDESAFATQGARVKTTPPLRSKADNRHLWQALAEGVIDAVASDHYFERSQRSLEGYPDIGQAPAGIAGLELSLPLLYHFGVVEGRLSLARFVEVMAANPAHITGLYPRKGLIAPGADADLVFIDPEEEWEIRSQGDFSRADTTPFVGWRLRGRVKKTFVRGCEVWDGEKIVASPGWGRYASYGG